MSILFIRDRILRNLFCLLLVLSVTACGSTAPSRQAELDAQQAAELAAAEIRAANAQEEQERQAALQRWEMEQEVRLAEQRRQEELRVREEESAAQRAVAEQERQRQQAIAQQQRQHQAEQDRLARLEREIAEAEAQVQSRLQANTRLAEAVSAAEQLLQLLNQEQAKYDNVDDRGQLRNPLQKERIAELEARKNSLLEAAKAPNP